MSKQKFQEGDRVVISKKYKSRYNCINKPGTIIDIDRTVAGDVLIPADDIHSIHTPSTRKMYYVQWDDKSFVSPYYSYELEKYVEMKFKVGDKVMFTEKAKQWLEDNGYWGVNKDDNPYRSVIDPNKVYTISNVFSSTQRYELEGVDYIEASDEDLLPAIDSKFNVGDQVILTEKAKNWLIDRGYVNIDLHQVYTILEVTTFFGHSYRLKGINSVSFFDDDLKLYDESKEGLTINEVMYNPRDDKFFDQRIDRMKKWVDICNEYLREFCDRHDYAYHPEDWIGGEVGGIIEIADMFVNMDNIRYDVDNEIPIEKFSDWYWNSIEHSELGLKYMNYPSYCKGAPDPYTQEQIQSIKEGQMRINKAKEDLRKTMDELGGDFNKLLF